MSVTVLPSVEVSPGLHALERHADTGWGWSLFCLRLPSGGTLVYNPSWLDERTLERVAEHGTPELLCVPNHFHHLSLARFRERWPQAVPVASARALPRLTAKGHAGLRVAEEVVSRLPRGSRWHLPEGTNTGELWLSVPHAEGATLLVGDAFFNLTRPTKGFTGFMLRRLGVAPGLRISTTYSLLGVCDLVACRASSLALVRTISPTEVAFSHGEVARGPDCGERLARAVEARWPTAPA